MNKVALLVFNGDPMCFIHVLLNALELDEKGYQVSIIIEGAAVKLLPELENPEHQLYSLWEKTKTAGLIAGVCRACSHKLGTLKSAEQQGLSLLSDMSGHPSIAGWMNKGYQIISF